MYNGISLSLALNDPELLMLKYVKALRVYAGDHRALGRSQMCDKIKWNKTKQQETRSPTSTPFTAYYYRAKVAPQKLADSQEYCDKTK